MCKKIKKIFCIILHNFCKNKKSNKQFQVKKGTKIFNKKNSKK